MFTLNATHQYAEEGTYTVRVTISGIGNPTNAATVTLFALVAPVPLTVSCLGGARQGKTHLNPFSGPVATFTHNNPIEPKGLGEFTATINWGGAGLGSTTAVVTGASPNYTVSGSFTYSSAGTYSVAVTVRDDSETDTRTCQLVIEPITVSAKSDPWLAGMPSGTLDDWGTDAAPFVSPCSSPASY